MYYFNENTNSVANYPLLKTIYYKVLSSDATNLENYD